MQNPLNIELVEGEWYLVHVPLPTKGEGCSRGTRALKFTPRNEETQWYAHLFSTDSDVIIECLLTPAYPTQS